MFRKIHLKMLLILVLPLLLVACAKKGPNSSRAMSKKQSNTTLSSAACVGDAYLQKYGCSTERIQQAAQSGDPDAQYALGYMYYYGIGIARDSQTARLWIKRAAGQGQPLAKKAESLLLGGSHLNSMRQHHDQIHPATASGNRSPVANSDNNIDTQNTFGGHEPKKNIRDLNNTVPAKSLSEHLPNYKKSKMDTASSGSVIRNLKKKSIAADTATDTRTNQAEPTTEPLTHATSPRPATQGSMLTASEKALLNVSARSYTLQLMGGHNLNAIKAFVRRNHLQGNVQYYSAKLKNRKWYMLIYGTYPTVMRAHAAAAQLPTSLRKLHPWIKSFRIVHKQIYQRKIVS